ncbi:unnamed protein product [Closterium sp. Yama58-4]|nr:unnamed protein product [Closterium sp. Yama58-4]
MSSARFMVRRGVSATGSGSEITGAGGSFKVGIESGSARAAFSRASTWQEGFTYDSRLNPMLAGGRLRLRLDRCLLRLHHLRLCSPSLLGTHPIPGGSYSKQRRVKGQPTMVDLPLLPSDHFGLLLVLHRGEGEAVGRGDAEQRLLYWAVEGPRELKLS